MRHTTAMRHEAARCEPERHDTDPRDTTRTRETRRETERHDADPKDTTGTHEARHDATPRRQRARHDTADAGRHVRRDTKRRGDINWRPRHEAATATRRGDQDTKRRRDTNRRNDAMRPTRLRQRNTMQPTRCGSRHDAATRCGERASANILSRRGAVEMRLTDRSGRFVRCKLGAGGLLAAILAGSEGRTGSSRSGGELRWFAAAESRAKSAAGAWRDQTGEASRATVEVAASRATVEGAVLRTTPRRRGIACESGRHDPGLRHDLGPTRDGAARRCDGASRHGSRRCGEATRRDPLRRREATR